VSIDPEVVVVAFVVVAAGVVSDLPVTVFSWSSASASFLTSAAFYYSLH
jgi:hypothetical protein